MQQDGGDVVEPDERHVVSQERPVLIIDGMNLFVRCYCAFPAVSSHGYQLGGMLGFVKTLMRLSNDLVPSGIVIAWEGGGSQRRRKLYPDYKMNRRPEKLNRFYEDDIPDTDENRLHQNVALVKLLKHVPVWQVYADCCEGDDMIAHIVSGPLLHRNVIIGSSDKDMHQLLCDRVRQYSFHKKRIMSAADVYAEYGILAENFGIAKAICGDHSDNVPGVPRIGFKTLTKHVPLMRQQGTLLDDVLKYVASHRTQSMPCERIFAAEQIVRRNWELVKLDIMSMPASKAAQVATVLSVPRPRLDVVGVCSILAEEGTSALDIGALTTTFTRYVGCKIT